MTQAFWHAFTMVTDWAAYLVGLLMGAVMVVVMAAAGLWLLDKAVTWSVRRFAGSIRKRVGPAWDPFIDDVINNSLGAQR